MSHSTSRLVPLSVLLLSLAAFAQTPQNPPPTTTAATTTASPDEVDRADRARYLFKFAVAAIKKSDYIVGEEKLREAAELVPDNALIWYNLATVQAKNKKIYPAVDSVNKALSLGLTGADHDAAEDLQIELSYTLSKPPKEPRLLANPVFFAVEIPRGPTVSSPRIQGMGEVLAKSLLRVLTVDSSIIIRGKPEYPAGELSAIPNCPTGAVPQRFNLDQYAALKAQWYQCVESQVRMRTELIRDQLRKEGFDGLAVLALEATQGRRNAENPTVTGTLFLVNKDGQLTKLDNIAASAASAEALSNMIAEHNAEAVQRGARAVRLLEAR